MCLAIPGKVLEAVDSGWNRIAKVQFGGVTRQVYLDFVPEAGVGDYVLVHVGFAVSKVDEAEAKRTYELLEQMGALEEGVDMSVDAARKSACATTATE
jgi:hydrogenase expression/formation protein HypC